MTPNQSIEKEINQILNNLNETSEESDEDSQNLVQKNPMKRKISFNQNLRLILKMKSQLNLLRT